MFGLVLVLFAATQANAQKTQPPKNLRFSDETALTGGSILTVTPSDSPVLNALSRRFAMTAGSSPVTQQLFNKPLLNQLQQTQNTTQLEQGLSHFDALAADMAKLTDQSITKTLSLFKAAQAADIPIILENVDAKKMALLVGMGFQGEAAVVIPQNGGRILTIKMYNESGENSVEIGEVEEATVNLKNIDKNSAASNPKVSGKTGETIWSHPLIVARAFDSDALVDCLRSNST
jgi:hypothetical protein